MYNTIKADYDKISEQIESKKAQRELFKGFIQVLEKQGTLIEKFDEGLWSSLMQEVVVKAKSEETPHLHIDFGWNCTCNG